jgi:GNAT superfamily N-acetyltransferase
MHLLRQLLLRLNATLTAFRDKGLRAGFAELGQTLLRIFYQKAEYVIVAHPLSEELTPMFTKSDTVIRQVKTRDEITGLSSIADPADMARFYKMFDNGSIAFIAWQNGQVAGYCWISDEIDRSVNRVQPPLSTGDACVHDWFVAPAYRSQGLGKTLVAHRLRFLRERGYRRALAVVLKDNAPALKVDKKTGYAEIGEMSHTRILFWDSFQYNVPEA